MDSSRKVKKKEVRMMTVKIECGKEDRGQKITKVIKKEIKNVTD